MKPAKIIKLKFSKEEQEAIDRIKKGEPVRRTRILRNKRGYEFEIKSTPKPLVPDVAKKKLVEYYGGRCTGCSIAWPDYHVLYDVGDERQSAVRIVRYCQECFDKQPIADTYNKLQRSKNKK